MPSLSIKSYLKELIASKRDKFEDDFDIEWNLFSTLCLTRSEKCLRKKTEDEKLLFRDYFMKKCKTKSELLSFFLKDQHFKEDVEELFQNFLKDSGLSNENKKSAAVSRFLIDSNKNKIENSEKSLANYNMALIYCPYSPNATNPSDTLLYAKILLKRSELLSLSLKIEDALLDLKEGFNLLNELPSSEERDVLYCKFLYAKSIFLDLLDYKEYEQKMNNLKIEAAIEQFKLNTFLKDKLNKYYGLLNQVFLVNKELIKKEFNSNSPKRLEINELKANSKLPGASTSVELCELEGKGRCTRVNQTIKSGQILFVEQPIVSWLRPVMYKFYCNNCYIPINNHFMTCFHCIKIKYCSSKCRDEAWEKYHSLECKFLECLSLLGYGQMVLRSMILFDQDEMMNLLVKDQNEEMINEEDKSLNEINSNEKEKPKSVSLESILNENQDSEIQEQISPRALIENNEQKIDNDYWIENGFPSNLDYKSFHSLVGDEKHLNFFQLISFCYGVSLLGRFAKKMGLVDEDDRFFYVFHSTILSHILKINFNCYSINDHSLNLNTKYNLWTHSNDFTKIGIAVYQSSSIISHSCDNNSSKISLGSKIIIYAKEKIKKSQEITVTYGPNYRITSYHDRKTLLKNGYLFNCECKACKEKLENLTNAFKCQNCLSGALIWNNDYSNHCLKCKIENQDLNPLIIKINEIQEEFSLAAKLLDKNKFTECKKKLVASKKILKAVFYSELKFDSLYKQFMDYYTKKGRFNKASKYAAILAKLQRTKDGNNKSMESVLYSIKAISLMVLHLKNNSSIIIPRLSSGNQKISRNMIHRIHSSYDKTLNDFNQLNLRQCKLIEVNFLPYLECFEFVEKFLKESNVII